MDAVLDRAGRIRLLVLDVDGVLTDGRLYISAAGEELKVFLSKGGVQSDLAALAPYPGMKIGGNPVSPDKLPKGLKHFADLGVVMPAWMDVRVIHRLPQPAEEELRRSKGINPGTTKSVAYVDCPRPLITPRGDYLLTVVSGNTLRHPRSKSEGE